MRSTSWLKPSAECAKVSWVPKVIFESADGGTRREVEASFGQSLLEISHQNGVDIEGACEGSMACSTCHLVIAREFYDRLPPPSEEEEDMLCLTFGLRPTSRLGCQVILSEELDGMVVRLPSQTINMADD